MAFQIPYDQIKELQISLRKEAGFASYNPGDLQLPDLPSLQDAISQLDPSPAHLRCNHCKGRLLRGVNSGICVFCGRQQNKDAPPPHPITFTSTFGCRWFLQSLDLDGSELVAPSVETNESNRGQNSPKIEFPLSDLLALEIRWPSEPEKFEISAMEKTPAWQSSTLNLAGVNLDFFTEAKVDSVSATTEEHFAVNKHEDANASNESGGHGNLSLFENVEPSETVATRSKAVATRSKEDESGDSFSGWEADFKSAGSGTQQQESKLSDPFVGSSPIDLSSHMDAVFGPGKDLFNEKTKENITSSSNRNDWFEGDLWSNPNAGVAVQDDKIEVPINDKDHRMVGNTNNSSMSIDWIQDNQWQTTTSSTKVADNRTIDKDDDAFDAWNDFTSSSTVQVASGNSLKQDVNHTVSSIEQASESLFSGTNNSKDVDFVSFSQPELFPATLNHENGYAEVNIMVPESSVSDRVASLNERDEGSAEDVEKIGKISNENANSKSDVDTIMSQMHDLSFMLASDLSVPQKKDPQKIDSFSLFSKD